VRRSVQAKQLRGLHIELKVKQSTPSPAAEGVNEGVSASYCGQMIYSGGISIIFV
jgi:hypothetical protein